MSKVKNGLLTFLGAFLATIVHRLSFGFIDALATLAIESSNLPELIAGNMVYLCAFSVLYCASIYAVSGFLASKTTSLYCSAIGNASERSIRMWLLFTVAITALSSFSSGATVVNTCCALGLVVPSYLTLRYRPFVVVNPRNKQPGETVRSLPTDTQKPPKRSKVDLVLAFVLGMLFGGIIFFAIMFLFPILP